MSQAQQAAAELTLGRTWPDRRQADRRAPPVLDTRTVDIDPTVAWLAEKDRRHVERRQFAEKPIASAFADLVGPQEMA